MINYILTFVIGMVIGELAAVIVLAMCEQAKEDDEREGR